MKTFLTDMCDDCDNLDYCLAVVTPFLLNYRESIPPHPIDRGLARVTCSGQ